MIGLGATVGVAGEAGPGCEAGHLSEDPSSAPIVEEQPSGDTIILTLRALQQRIRQQEILAELGIYPSKA